MKLLATDSHAQISTSGSLAVGAVSSVGALSQPNDETHPPSAAIEATASKSATDLKFDFEFQTATLSSPSEPTGATQGASSASVTRAGASLSAQPTTLSAGSPTNPVEAERACAVPRNDPQNQALQPKPRQVEWAVDQALSGDLTVSRPANWMNLGMPAYTPQGLFPKVNLVGGGQIPAQILLGVIAQESNLWQADPYTTPGVTGNPLVGNFYGNNESADDSSFWSVDFYDEADCGYGVGQITDGMRLSGMERPGDVPAMAYQTQRAVALDYAANVAAAARLLSQKWNETRNAGLTINNGDSSKIENWFFAVWDYNTGFHPHGASGPWGIGWANNPINPFWDQGRASFLDGSPSDAAHPQRWPYPEKVMGFAANSLWLYEDATTEVAAFTTAWWNGNGATGALNRTQVKPPLTKFCSLTINDCNPSNLGNPCNLASDECWYHGNATWKSACPTTCGNENLRFDPGWAYQADATSFPSNCSLSGLPTGALVIDDVPGSSPPVRSPCTQQTDHGSFGFTFAQQAGTGSYVSKMDLHQLGAGFNGHFYFTHTRQSGSVNDLFGALDVTGTWTLDHSISTWARVLVHMPDHGAWTQQAAYTINFGNGQSETRTLLQRRGANQWADLGVFQMNGTPSISLSNLTKDGIEIDDVAWDAVAIQPLPSKPADFIVSLGDSFASGEGASELAQGLNYYRETDNNGSDAQARNACHRSTQAWSRKATLATSSATIGQRADSWNSNTDFHFLACSGAETENLLPYFSVSGTKPTNAEDQDGRDGSYGELSQLDQGYLDDNTTLVTLSIGGNDVKFAKILEHCILYGLPGCPNTALSEDGSEILLDATQRRLDDVLPDSLAAVLGAIQAKAPNARILLMGYPEIFAGGTGCVYLDAGDKDWLNDVSVGLAATMSAAAADANSPSHPVTFVDPQPYFAGRDLCDSSPGLNRLVYTLTPGDKAMFALPIPGPDFGLGISQQSVHPNMDGTTLYAQAMSDALNGVYP